MNSQDQRRILPCRVCLRIRYVDGDGHCTECVGTEQRLLTDGGYEAGELTALEPREALEMWVDRQRSERSDATIQSYFYRTQGFVDWLESEGINNLNELTGRDLYRFDSYRRSQGLAPSTLKTQLGTIRIFLSFCEDIEAVPRGFSEKMAVPTLTKNDRTNDEKLTAERAQVIRDGLKRYRRASRDHVLFVIAWETGCRLGALRSLDLQDCYLTEEDLEGLRHRDDVDEDILTKIDVPFLYFRHRPDTDTQLKNKEAGERPVNLSEETGELVQEYITVNRVPTKDDFGRKPLFSTHKGQGRMTTGAIRARFNIMTQPCRYGTCPHDRDKATCEALQHGKESRCPSSRSPHRIRTGSITHHRDRGWPPEVLSEKVNATPEVIRDHYDHPDQLKRMQSRRAYLANLEEEGGE